MTLGPAALPVVCLHGFTGTPHEVLPLARALTDAGHQLSTPLLPGHGRQITDLARSTWHDWMEAADSAVSSLVLSARSPVAIVGASMGGLLALDLARRRPADIAALVLLSPPLRFKRLEALGLAWLLRLARLAGITERVIVPKAFGADVRDPGVRALVPALSGYPLPALSTLSELMKVASADLEHVRTPVLLVHGKHDRTVSRAAVEELEKRLGAGVCQRLCLERSGHLVALDYDRAALNRAVLEFLRTRAHAR